MSVQPRAPRNRRGGHGPGGMLLTALLVLAILASSTLVFTSRVELLRLAVVLSLWAAVVAAFVTVIYRRQSDAAQARARDMKFVYDLQLDREISARREYELSVEARLRRQMSMESGQAADEMAALRTELASLRSHLEVMLGTDLAPRPALEGDRVAVPMPAAPGRVESSRVTVVTEEIVEFAGETDDDIGDFAAESPIIDVAEEPLTPAYEEPVVAPEPAVRTPYRRPEPPAQRYVEPAPQQPETPWRPPETRPGRHGTLYPPRPGPVAQAPPVPPPPPVPPQAPPPPRGRHWVPPGVPPVAPPDPAGRHRGPLEPPVEQPPVEQPPAQEEPDRTPEPETAQSQGQHADGQSFADLMERLKIERPAGGGRRRRRED